MRDKCLHGLAPDEDCPIHAREAGHGYSNLLYEHPSLVKISYLKSGLSQELFIPIFALAVDVVVIAIGNNPNPLIPRTTPGLAVQKWGGIIADENTGKTSRDRVYAGGDIVTGAATVILAMGAGKNAACAIHKELTGEDLARAPDAPPEK
jgi:pyruvate/2-oxoglutarate dehydrogenase complex dihydrolipoamide dehydrogenase (E3) component